MSVPAIFVFCLVATTTASGLAPFATSANRWSPSSNSRDGPGPTTKLPVMVSFAALMNVTAFPPPLAT